MKTNHNIQHLHYPWNKFVLYIFDELPIEEVSVIENMIFKNDEYSIAVNSLMHYCRKKKIYTSNNFFDFLKERKMEVFQSLKNKGVDLPDNFFEEINIEQPSVNETIVSKKTKRIKKNNRSKKWLAIFLLIASLGTIVYYFQKPPPSIITPPIDSYEEYIKEKIDNEKEEDTTKTITETQNSSPPITKPNDWEEGKDYLAKTTTYDLSKDIHDMKENTRSGDTEPSVEELLEKKELDNREKFQLGLHYLDNKNNAFAINYLSQVIDTKPYEVRWFLLYALLSDKNKASFDKAKILYQTKLKNEDNPKIKNYIKLMPNKLKQLLDSTD